MPAIVTAIFDMSKYVKDVYYLHQLKIIKSSVILQSYWLKYLNFLSQSNLISGFFTSLDVAPYKGMMGNILTSFIKLTRKVRLSVCSSCIFGKYYVLLISHNEKLPKQ